MTPEWKDEVRAALAQHGGREQWLANEVAKRRGMPKMKRDTINKLLRHQRTSALVPDICEILGVRMPMTATALDDETRQLIDLALKAPPDIRRAVIALLLGSRPT